MIQKVKKYLCCLYYNSMFMQISLLNRENSSSENQHILISTFNLLHLTYRISYIH